MQLLFFSGHDLTDTTRARLGQAERGHKAADTLKVALHVEEGTTTPFAQVYQVRLHPKDPPSTPHHPGTPTCDASPRLSCLRAGQELLPTKKQELLPPTT